MKNKLLLLYCWFIRIFFFIFPDVPFIMRLRGWLYGLGMMHRGVDFQVTHDAIIKDVVGISVGDHVFVGNGTVIMGSGTIVVEDEVQFAPHCIIISGNHTLKDGSFRYGEGDKGHIMIGRGAWVAGNCTIQKDSTLPSGSVLSANSFLNKIFEEPLSLYGGVPAKFIKKIEQC